MVGRKLFYNLNFTIMIGFPTSQPSHDTIHPDVKWVPLNKDRYGSVVVVLEVTNCVMDE